jgi:hypothetical protein
MNGHDSTSRHSTPFVRTAIIDHGKRESKTYHNGFRKLPDPTFVSSSCKNGKHGQCPSLRCSCTCHGVRACVSLPRQIRYGSLLSLSVRRRDMQGLPDDQWGEGRAEALRHHGSSKTGETLGSRDDEFRCISGHFSEDEH